MSLAALKSRGATRINKLVDNVKNSDRSKDDRFWKPTVDKAGNSFAVVRFLPERDEETNMGFVKLFRHYFEGPNGRYVENCLTTLGQADPVQNHVFSLWKEARGGDKDAEDNARKLGRKARYYANVLIVEDKDNSDNEGKVFIWEFGQKVYDKLEAMFAPESEYEEKKDPWDIFGDNGGANFKVKLRKVGGFPNYDLCAFDMPSAISLKGKALNDAAIEKVLDQRHDLDSIISSDKFKSFDELNSQFSSVMGTGQSATPRQRTPEPAKPVSRPSPKREEVTYEDDAAIIQGILDGEDD